MPTPIWLPPRFDTIPGELQKLSWVLWRAQPVPPTEKDPDPKPKKVPYRISEPTWKASSTDPATWGTFEDAVEAYLSLVELPAVRDLGPIVGIGVVLPRGGGIVCIDLDGVVDADTLALTPRAEKFLGQCPSWTERSPSGSGLHIFVKGTIPRGIAWPPLEVYGHERYIAVSGWTWPGTSPIVQPQQRYLDHIVRSYETLTRPSPAAYTGPTVAAPDDLAGALLAKLQQWRVPFRGLKAWSGGFLVELIECPWASVHTSTRDGAAVIIHASGAWDFTCLHSHCGRRTWADFRSAMESR